MAFFQSLQVAVRSFGVAPAVIIAFLWGVVIVDFWRLSARISN